MNQSNSSPRVFAPMPNGVASSTCAPERSERDRATSVGNNGTEMVPGSVPDLVRSAAINTLDRDLWAAGQSIAAYRQERLAIYRALDEATVARVGSEHDAASARKKYHQMKTQYHQLLANYTSLSQQYNGLQQQHDHACRERARVLEDQRKLLSTKTASEEEKALREALDLELQQTKHELGVLEDWKCQELLSHNLTIDKLKEEIKEKDSQLEQFSKDLDSLKTQQHLMLSENVAGFETKDAQIAKLMAEGAIQIQESDKKQQQIATLSAELESARIFIQALEELQNKMEQVHSGEIENFRQENINLKEVLDEMSASYQLHNSFQEASQKAETELELLHNENVSLTQQIECVRKTLAARFPGLSDSLDNLADCLAENEEDKKRKKRKSTK
ncbi:hypothetical protein FOQG_12271 [Fusarium oxysporum f. sp. raphani 54005]|uniref:Uncharacterized protein n=2 Tax=Fusarium oxysporum f. sp. raphani TaxID=96318 RepID=X0BY20_FUSOX|nr:hypothetical protein FOQG_12271 [Fusarium oxysporum f. sp. raphani 54005]KAG7434048.1 hypothetical protein Forpi1262_v005418 [Fusarium oxysporum f. sp. raphani]